MLRILLVVLGLASAWYAPAAAQWVLPAGVKTLEVNGYPMSFLESGTGEPVVLVHGAATDYRSWTQQTASLHGFRLIAISLRHYYPEPWNGKGDTFSVKQHAEDLAAFIEALGVGPVALVGHSRGATVSVKAALARPALVKKLVLMEGPFDAFQPRAESGEIKSPARAVIPAIKQRFEQGDIDGGLELWADRDNNPGTWARRSEQARQRSRDNAATLIPDGGDNPVTCADLAALQMPVLLMQGDKSPRRFASIVDATHKCLPSAERATIPDAGHAMHVMNPAGFEKMLVQFLSR